MNTNTNTAPALAFYHANEKGTGSAAKFFLIPARNGSEGHIIMEVANQIGYEGAKGGRFDFDNSIIVNLGFAELCQMLQVFRGECESINEGRGLYHIDTQEVSRVYLRHIIEPKCGYQLQVQKKDRKTDTEKSASILLSSYEALGLCEAIAGSLSVIAFGLPMVVTPSTGTE